MKTHDSAREKRDVDAPMPLQQESNDPHPVERRNGHEGEIMKQLSTTPGVSCLTGQKPAYYSIFDSS